MPLLRLDKASLSFGPLALLDAVDFSLSRGKKVGLLGRNGAGKTTMLKELKFDKVNFQKAAVTLRNESRSNG